MADIKTILTMDDLFKFCVEQNFEKFSAKESGYKLAVTIPTTFEEVEKTDDTHVGMMKLCIKIFHTELNRNNSYVSREAAERAMKTIADRPVLAAIHQLDNGEYDFEGHEMEIVTNDDGDKEIKYIESQVGSFSSEPAFWMHDDENDKDFVCAYAYISEEYTKAAEIIRRKNGTKNSCELYINEMAYNAKDKYIDLLDFYVNASTLLGSRNDGTEIGEGMLGSRADICDFSTENNSVKYELNQIIQEAVHMALDNYTKAVNSAEDNSKEGGEPKVKLKELLEKYSKTMEDITFETEGLSDKELENAFKEAFEVDEPEAEVEPEVEPEVAEVTEDEVSDEPEEVPEPTPEEASVEFTVKNGDTTKTFSLSLNEKLSAFYNLINDTYGELDNDFYDVQVYEDEKTVEMFGYFTGKAYRQTFKCKKKEEYQLVGDRVEIFSVWMTNDEKIAFENMKANYSLATAKLEHYETEPEKVEILASAKYKYVADTKEFAELAKKDNHFELSVEEVEQKADVILLDYAAKGALKFSVETPETTKQINGMPLPFEAKSEDRYGDLFRK